MILQTLFISGLCKMKLIEFRNNINLSYKEIGDKIGVSEDFLKNNGNKPITELSRQVQCGLKLLKSIKELKNELEVLKRLIKG